MMLLITADLNIGGLNEFASVRFQYSGPDFVLNY